MPAFEGLVWRHSNFQSETFVFRAELNQRCTWSRMDIETAVWSFVAWLLWCKGFQLHLTGRHDNETLWIEVLSKTTEMREDKAKKTGKDEIDGWNMGEEEGEGGGRKWWIQTQSNKVYKNHFSFLNKMIFFVSNSLNYFILQHGVSSSSANYWVHQIIKISWPYSVRLNECNCSKCHDHLQLWNCRGILCYEFILLYQTLCQLSNTLN